MNKLIKHDLVRGLKDVTFEKDKLCSACQARKQVGNTHPKKSIVDRISSVVLRGVSHEGRLIGREACDQEQEGNKTHELDRFRPSV